MLRSLGSGESTTCCVFANKGNFRFPISPFILSELFPAISQFLLVGSVYLCSFFSVGRMVQDDTSVLLGFRLRPLSTRLGLRSLYLRVSGLFLRGSVSGLFIFLVSCPRLSFCKSSHFASQWQVYFLFVGSLQRSSTTVYILMDLSSRRLSLLACSLCILIHGLFGGSL